MAQRTVIRFGVFGETQVARAFDAMAHEVADLSVPLRRMGEQILGAVSEQFRTEGEHGLGSKWQPLNPDYAIWKEQQVGDEPILVFTGAMREKMLSRESITVTPRRLTYAPDDHKIERHQLGEGHLPARKIVALSEFDRRRAVDRVFAEWLNELRRGPMWSSP